MSCSLLPSRPAPDLSSLTFEQLARLEPRLLGLERAAARTKKVWDIGSCWLWYRDRIEALVGWERPGPEHPVLSTSEAYDVAGNYILELLEDSRKRRKVRARLGLEPKIRKKW